MENIKEIPQETLENVLKVDEPNLSSGALPPRNAPRTKKGTLSPTPKQKKFAKEYVKSLNGTQSALKVYDTTDYKTAQNIASENLAKPIIRAEIERLLRDNDIKLSGILEIHKRNMLQDTNYPTSQKAVSDFYEILGMKNTEKLQNEVKIAFVIEK